MTFLTGTTYESLVHKLGRKNPRTTKELLDITTSYASGEEAVGAMREEHASEGTSDRFGKKKNKKGPVGPLVAATDCKGG